MATPTDLLPAAPNEVFKPGAFVRSYDFPGCWDSYVEGYVAGYGGDVFPSDVHYRVAVVRRVWEGRQLPDDKTEKVVYPPMRGSLGRRLVHQIAPPETAVCFHCKQRVTKLAGSYAHECLPKACPWEDWKPARDL